MRLTDWCIVFAAVCLCFFVPLDLKIGYLAEAFCQQEQYERRLDRICEDSLMDSILQENEDGTILADQDRIYRRFEELLQLEFDAISSEERQYLCDCIRIMQFEYLQPVLSPEDTDRIRERFEQIAAGQGQEGAPGRAADKFAFYFPYITQEDWYQNIAGPSLYSLFEPDSSGDPWEPYRRYVFSGGRIVKQEEAQSGSVQSGFYRPR